MNIAEACKLGTRELKSKTDIADLESSLLLAHVLDVKRAYLHTWPEKQLDVSQEQQFLKLVNRRKLGEPLAYILGHKEFWSLDFIVTPDVLIPRPETELLVECVLRKIPHETALVADLGTGSGVIGLVLASEKPNWTIHATDKSEQALTIAQLNKKNLNIQNVTFHLGNWCEPLPDIQFDVIVSNPPYIADNDPELQEDVLRFEPHSALISPEEGLKDIHDIIFSSRQYLKPNGLLCVEHGYRQAKEIARILEQAGYTDREIVKDLAGLDRVTIASWQGFDIN